MGWLIICLANSGMSLAKMRPDSTDEISLSQFRAVLKPIPDNVNTECLIFCFRRFRLVANLIISS